MSPLAVTILWASLLLIAWRWRPPQAASPSAWVLLIAFGALGATALWFDFRGHPEPAGFDFWKPTVVYWTLAALMWLDHLEHGARGKADGDLRAQRARVMDVLARARAEIAPARAAVQ